MSKEANEVREVIANIELADGFHNGGVNVLNEFSYLGEVEGGEEVYELRDNAEDGIAADVDAHSTIKASEAFTPASPRVAN